MQNKFYELNEGDDLLVSVFLNYYKTRLQISYVHFRLIYYLGTFISRVDSSSISCETAFQQCLVCIERLREYEIRGATRKRRNVLTPDNYGAR